MIKQGANKLKKAAVVLSGCGVYDGSEITEAVSLFVALTKFNIPFQCYAPNKNQMHVIDHTTGNELEQARNVLIESARIARGNVKDLTSIDVQEYDALFVPGGFGAAKNLSDFAVKGGDLTLDPEFAKVLQQFHEKERIIAACCISPILLAKAFGTKGAELTLGCCTGDKWPYAGSIEAAKSLGAKPQEKQVNEVCVDKVNRLITTPAFMYEGSFYEISQGVEAMVKAAVEF